MLVAKESALKTGSAVGVNPVSVCRRSSLVTGNGMFGLDEEKACDVFAEGGACVVSIDDDGTSVIVVVVVAAESVVVMVESPVVVRLAVVVVVLSLTVPRLPLERR